ncbi:hypothetical protein SUDANB15_06236 [Streptomyces sp. enrichment culture]|uniref:hypothetical protein n=1 Tax=Streptomyces sp. enrichment culture TaxID=1795815 RepID=UPI003F57612F
MSDGFYHWYTGRQDRGGVERVLHVLETHGVRLAHPSSQVVTAVTNGPDSWGEQLPVERAELIGLLTLTDGTEVNFQFWLNERTDMFTRFRRLADGRMVAEFGLDGMWSTEQETAVRAISHVVDTDQGSTWGVVIDRRGLTEETDWAGVALGRPVEITGWPDALGVRPEAAARHPRLRSAQGVSRPPLVFFGKDAGG